MTAVYRPSRGAPFTALEAQKIGESLADIEKEKGLTPAAVVAAAGTWDSPLHRHFEWNDSKAAKAHRMGQARTLIGCVRVIVSGKGTPAEQRERAFVSVREGDENTRSYVSFAVVAKDPGLHSQLVAEGLRRAEQWADRYGREPELEAITKAIQRAAKLLAKRLAS